MSQIKKVTVEQAEGLTSQIDQPHTFEWPDCVEAAETQLRQIALDAPADGGYYKVYVVVTLADGTEVRLRMDVMRLGTPDNDLDILPNLRRYLEAYSGEVVPEQYRSKYTQARWQALMCSRNGTEATMELRRALQVFNESAD